MFDVNRTKNTKKRKQTGYEKNMPEDGNLRESPRLKEAYFTLIIYFYSLNLFQAVI